MSIYEKGIASDCRRLDYTTRKRKRDHRNETF